MAGLQSVLYDTAWQKLRVSTLAKHHRGGGWMTGAGTDDNLKRFNQYLESAQTSPDEHALRVWRILNMLNAVRMGYSGMGQRGTAMDKSVEEYRDNLREQYDGGTVARLDPKWDWDKVRSDLEAMWLNDRYWFDAIQDNLADRRKHALKKTGNLDDRKQLEWFLNTMSEITLVKP